MSGTKTEGTLEGWCILELMGRRKLGGWICEQTIAGTGFLRIDVCDTNGKPVATQYYQPSAVYCITPTTEETATKYGATHQPQPVTLWELPQVQSSVNVEYGLDEDEEEEPFYPD